MIPDADRQNFNTLYSAFQSGNLALLEARRKSDGKQVSLIVAVHHDKEQTYNITPFAVMVEGNPFEDFIPASSPDYDQPEEGTRHVL